VKVKSKYRVNIIWSEQDGCYLVELPEFAHKLQQYFTHGDTYVEAVANAQEVLDLLIEDYKAQGKSLPQPQTLQPVSQRRQLFSAVKVFSEGLQTPQKSLFRG
jgi:antitoxin HicB